MEKQILSEEFNRMQKLAGIISEIKAIPPKKLEDINVDNDGKQITLSGDSGDYDGFIKNDGTVSFSVVYQDEDDRDGMEFDDQNWKDILGDDHVFVKVANIIPTKVEAIGDYVMITVKADDLS